MHFEGDAFISYAHLDNVELVEGRKGWVAGLHRALEVRIAQFLGKPPAIWRDLKLSGNDLFADTIVERLRKVAILVAVVSPRYVKSEWAIRELNEFWRAAESQGGIRVGDKARVFKVLKTPVQLDRTPKELQALLGYEFFKVDPDTGKVRELDEIFGAEAHRDFWLRLDDLAYDIVGLLERIEGDGEASALRSTALPPAADGAEEEAPEATPAPLEGETVALAASGATQAATPIVPPAVASGSPATAAAPGRAAAGAAPLATVYLAETTSDLREQREAMRRDLLQAGYAVLPTQALPHVADEAEAAIREQLARAKMSIHFIGKHYGLVPEGSELSLIQMQHELATAQCEEAGLMRLIWIPNGLQLQDDRQLRVIERLRADPRIGDGSDLLETYFEDVRTSVHDWLKRGRTPAPATTAKPAPGEPRRVYLIAEERDVSLLQPWADALFDEGLEVIQPIYEGEEREIREYHEENLASCDGVCIFYGSGNELWLRRKLRELQKAPGYGRTKPPPTVGICLVGARTPEKERFRTHEATVIPQWDGVAMDRLAPIVTAIKAGGDV